MVCGRANPVGSTKPHRWAAREALLRRLSALVEGRPDGPQNATSARELDSAQGPPPPTGVF
jgi:hypothetical protein